MALAEPGYHAGMKLRRSSRIVAALVALFSMLFMQLAVASYRCPVNDIAAAMETPCESMDPSQPSLCKAKASDLVAKQSLDKPDVPPVLPFIPSDLAGLVLAADWTPLPAAAATAPPSLARSTAPPITIENCCFRN